MGQTPPAPASAALTARASRCPNSSRTTRIAFEAYKLGLWEQATELGARLGVPADRTAEIDTDAVTWASEQLAPNAVEAA